MVATSTSHTIFFIASLVVASAVVAVCTSVIYSLQGDIEIKGNLLSDVLVGDITIINDENIMPNDPVILYVLNSGKNTLDHSSINILIDGELISSPTISILNATTWTPDTVVQVNVSTALATGDHYCKVSINELEDSIQFRI